MLARCIADDLAPEHVVKSRVRPSSRWFDADCRQARRRCRRFERPYHQRRTPDNRQAWIAATKSKLDLFQSKRDAYWPERVKVDGQTNRLWRTLSDVLGRSKSRCDHATLLDAAGFAEYFVKKVGDIRDSTASLPVPGCLMDGDHPHGRV